MTRKELCDQYNIAESSIKNTFPAVQKRFLKKGYILRKEGRGDNAQYFITVANDHRAETLLKETKTEIFMSQAEFRDLKDFRFIVFLAIITTPMLTFRGTFSQFLNYIEVEDTKYNRKILKESFKDLVAANFIDYTEDNSTDEGYFLVWLPRKRELEMSLGIDMVRRCKKLGDEYHEKMGDLIKVWTAMGYAYYNQPFTMGDLENLTGLSPYKIRKAKKILEGDDLFCTSKVYDVVDGSAFCSGQIVNFNGIPHENRDLLDKIQTDLQ